MVLQWSPDLAAGETPLLSKVITLENGTLQWSPDLAAGETRSPRIWRRPRWRRSFNGAPTSRPGKLGDSLNVQVDVFYLQWSPDLAAGETTGELVILLER